MYVKLCGRPHCLNSRIFLSSPMHTNRHSHFSLTLFSRQPMFYFVTLSVSWKFHIKIHIASFIKTYSFGTLEIHLHCKVYWHFTYLDGWIIVHWMDMPYLSLYQTMVGGGLYSCVYIYEQGSVYMNSALYIWTELCIYENICYEGQYRGYGNYVYLQVFFCLWSIKSFLKLYKCF